MDLDDMSIGSGLFLSRPRRPQLTDLYEGMPLVGGRYTLGRCLGSGRYATVYAAMDHLRGEEVALKASQGHGIEPETARAVLRHEAEVYRRIGSHAHVLRVFDLHFDESCCGGLLMLSMELADGGSLADWLGRYAQDPGYRESQGKTLFRALCEGIQTLHQAGIMHLDLSPANVVFSNGTLKVADLGAARYFHTIGWRSGLNMPPLGYAVGTPGYMAPELLRARHSSEVDKRVDIFSAGAIVYQMVHPECRTPFGSSLEAVSHVHERKPPALSIGDERLARVIHRCLEDIR